MKFKKGDTVQCIDDKGVTHIKKGKIYKVLYISSPRMVEIRNDLGDTEGYFADRFEYAVISNEERIKRRMHELSQV